jgi:outer membrane protein assembly factor BamB
VAAALATSDGAERWRVSITEVFKSKQPYWGFSTSLLVDGDLVILEGGGTEGKSYAALDRKTGAVRWTTGNGRGEAGYNSPLVVERGEQRSYLYLDSALRSVDREGRELWSFPWPEGETHAMPLLVPPDRVFASGAEGIGGRLLRVGQKDGKAEVSEVWSNPTMRNHFSSSVIDAEHLYGFDNATLKCIALSDAGIAWAKRGFGKGSLILADGHLIVLSETGELALVQATSREYVERGRIQALSGRCWTAPSLAGGKLYLRNRTEIVSYDLKG